MGNDETIYVAVGEGEESVVNLLWTLHNLRPPKVCILHVRQPSKLISSFGGDTDAVFQFMTLDDAGTDMMNRIIDDCLLLCTQAGVSATDLYISEDDVAKGIVELIRVWNIKKLVMGAAADKHFSEGMWLVSEKAQYVNDNAPLSCQIWFICSDHLVHTRFEQGQSSNAPSPSGSSYLTSSSEAVGYIHSVFEDREDSECGIEPFVLLRSGEDPDSLSEGNSNDQLYDQLEQALQEAESLNRKAFEERDRRVKAERKAVQAMRQAKAFERLYNESKRETEAALSKQKEEIEKMKKQKDEEHLIAMKQLEDKLSTALERSQVSEKHLKELQVELENTHKVTEELLRKQAESSSTNMQYFSEIHDATLDQLHICQKEKDELQVELENTRRITEDLLRKQGEETSTTQMLQQQPFTEFSVSEIQEATEDFHPSFKIAQGNRGSVYYKCVLRHTEVAIKVLGQNSLQDPSQFQQEVEDLSKSRHPNLVTLIGACPEIWALIYEYHPNGSLEDRLNCRNEMHPLSWKTRIHIATQLCSTLMFLHSCKPQSSVHGNLKPGNILLDANFGCKLSDFGAHRALSLLANPSNTNPYLDPDFVNTRRLSHSIDLYPFGVILLQLLSGRSTDDIAETAQNALLNGGNLNSFLDSSAGNWPHQVAQLTHLAIRCCDINRSRRPDLASEVFKVLETMRASSGASSSSSFMAEPDHEDNGDPPSYFTCPILQGIMSDPQVAADGHTYEATQIEEWLANHDTSPMTNLRLPHCNLVPNIALRSAIEDWLHQHQHQHQRH